MTKLALRELGDPRMVADDREIIAVQNGGSNYTADTVLTLQQEYLGRPLIWILGEDQLQQFTNWSRWQWLIQNVHLAVCARPLAASDSVLELLRGQGAEILWIEMFTDEVSSTFIRGQLRSGNPVDGLMPNSVINYISSKKLYR
jgi:nicotinate-nucleotide adenylyltransferase